jgi:RND family efflux transporter MFP subunit
MKWVIALAVVLLLGGMVLRTLAARKASGEQAGASLKLVSPLELSPGDVWVAGPQRLTRTLAISGGLKAVNTAVVKAKVAAEVKSLAVREGDSVKAGQVIGQLDVSELELRLQQAEQTAASSRAQLDIARRALVNNRALVSQGFISATGLETSISNEAAAQASYGAAMAAVDLARKSRNDARLVAPISGTVSQRLVQPGERVSIDARLVEVVDLSRIELEAAVAPEDVVALRVGQPARLQVDGLAQPVEGKVARINPSTQAGTRAVMVYVSVTPLPGLRQGLFAKGSIELQHQDLLAVPVSAVRIDQARPYVTAVVDGQAVQRPVTLGARGEALVDGQRDSVVEVTGGLAAGSVLLRGSLGLVREGTPVRLPPSAPAPASVAASAAH